MKYFFIILFFGPILSIAQDDGITFNAPGGDPLVFTTKSANFSKEDVKGTPYLDDEFKSGKVFVYDVPKKNARMRFNAYNSEIEIEQIGKEPFSLLKKGYISVVIGQKKYEILHYKDENNKIRTAYFNKLNKGNTVLLFKPEIKLKRGKQPSTSYDRKQPPTFINVSSYFIKKGDSVAQKLTLKKKNLIKFMEDEKESIARFVDDNKLNLKSESDVIQLLDYYNTLLN